MTKVLLAVFLVLVQNLVVPSLGIASLQDEPSSNANSPLTTAELENRLQNFKGVTDLDEASKSSIQQLFERARQQLDAASKFEAELKKFQELSGQSQVLLETVKQELAKTTEHSTLYLDRELTEAQLQEMLRQSNVALDQARQRAIEMASEMSRRQSRMVELPESIAKAELRLIEIRSQLDAAAPAGENSLLTQARLTQLTAEKQNLELQLAASNAEKSAYASTADLPPLNDQLAQRKLKLIEADVAKIKEQLARLRESEIEKRIRQAVEDLANAPEPLKSLAETNVDLAQKLQQSALRIGEVTKVENQIENARIALSKRYETTKIRVEAIGLSDTLGIMLRQNKSEVAKLQLRYGISPNLQVEVSENRAESFKSEDKAANLADLNEVFDNFVRDQGGLFDDRESLRGIGIELLEKQQQAWVRLSEVQNDSFNALFGLLTVQRKFAKLCTEYSSYINQHILWVRNAKVLGAFEQQKIIRSIKKEVAADSSRSEIVVFKSDFTSIAEAAQGIVAADKWQSVGRAIINGGRNRVSLSMVIGSGLLLLFCFHSRLKSNIRLASKKATRRSCREISPTLSTTMETILLSFLWPGVIMTLGWLIRADLAAESFALALGSGLIAVGITSAPLEFLRHVCRSEGLAQSHFDWPEPARLTIRSNVHWLIIAGAPLLLVTVTLQHLGNPDWDNSLGRVSTIALLLLTAVFMYRVMRPNSPVFRSSQDRNSRFYRLRYFRFGILAVGLVAMIAFATAGYYYTTYQLGVNFLQTVALSIGLLALYSVALRFLLVRRRRLRYEQLVQQREHLQKQLRLAADTNPDGILPAKNSDSLELEIQNELGTDINSVSRQAKELTGVIFVAATLVFLWQIWQDVLPATQLLDNVHLWQVTEGEKGETQWVSLRDLLISLGLFLVTFFSVRNIPGMLELLLLKQLPLDAGSRYAIISIFRYFIVVVGVILALNFLRIPWSKYSWLVAAISVGLGFGLQEIVANFVSGLIILLERPVRVGDVVTIDNTTGVVSRIQMRATTVTNWDNQELVVPNKDLVTGKIINWTLSSLINRVSLAVGVAYGSDIDKVQQLIMQVAAGNSNVLVDPPPMVTFEEFGDNALLFKLRCHITALDRRQVIVHELNSGIDAAFRREKIAIPFPQREVHLINPNNA